MVSIFTQKFQLYSTAERKDLQCWNGCFLDSLENVRLIDGCHLIYIGEGGRLSHFFHLSL